MRLVNKFAGRERSQDGINGALLKNGGPVIGIRQTLGDFIAVQILGGLGRAPPAKPGPPGLRLALFGICFRCYHP